jgi:flagellar biosynthesis/type III secretory pathway chaperone
MDILSVLLVWLIGIITGIAISRIILSGTRKQCLNILARSEQARLEAEAKYKQTEDVANQMAARYQSLQKLAESIQRFKAVTGGKDLPDWDQEKKKLPDQL